MTFETEHYHDAYRALNAGAHRKAGLEVDTPTVTRHIGYWFPTKALLDEHGTAALSLAQNGPLADGYIKSIYARLKKLPEFRTNICVPCRDPHDRDKTVEGAVFFADAVLDAGSTVSDFDKSQPPIVDLLASDNRIISMEARWKGFRVQVRADLHSEFFTLTTFLTLHDRTEKDELAQSMAQHLELLVELSRQAPQQTASLETQVLACHRFVYHDIWIALFADILDGTVSKDVKVFADFRGLVLAGRDDPVEGTACIGAESFKGSSERGRRFPPRWAGDRLVPAIQPLLLCAPHLHKTRQEFTASYMLRRRAVYMTSLGPQPVSEGTHRCWPLHYILVARPANDWQLGSLLDRLHVMGTVRLAGLMELSALRAAGANVKAVQDVADDARDALRKERYGIARSNIENIKRLTSHRNSEGRPLFLSGLQFRIERSRYYVARFRSDQRFLRIGRIEGFEPYDQFVEGRLGGVYDYVDRLGHRHERALAAASDLLQELQSAQAERQNKQTASLIGEIESIQFKAEIALLAFLLPYYTIATLHYIFEATECCKGLQGKLFIAIAVAFLLIAIFNWMQHVFRRADGELERKRPSMAVVLVMAIAALLLPAWQIAGLVGSRTVSSSEPVVAPRP